MPAPLLWWLVAINLVTAAAYAYDKLAAPRGGRRIRERTLWILCLAGGVGGAWLVFFGMRHKTQHQVVLGRADRRDGRLGRRDRVGVAGLTRTHHMSSGQPR